MPTADFAQMEMRVVLSHVIHNFDLQLTAHSLSGATNSAGDADYTKSAAELPEAKQTLRPRRGLMVKLTPRRHAEGAQQAAVAEAVGAGGERARL